MRTGQNDNYIQELDSIVGTRNKEIAEQLSKSNGRSPGPGELHVTSIEPDTVLSIVKLNLKNMHSSYELSVSQANVIFWVATSACIVGIVLIALSFVFALLGKFAFDKALVTAIGGVAIELFAGTTQVVYKSSLKQMNFYHKSLHEDQRFLSAVDLLCRFSNDENRDEMLKTIICSSMQISVAAAAEGDEVAETPVKKP